MTTEAIEKRDRAWQKYIRVVDEVMERKRDYRNMWSIVYLSRTIFMEDECVRLLEIYESIE